MPLYVGSTAHTVECNYENGHLGNKGEQYTCPCFQSPELRDVINRPTTKRRRPVKLRYDLFADLNPVPKGTGTANEKALAKELRKAGFLVWQK